LVENFTPTTPPAVRSEREKHDAEHIERIEIEINKVIELYNSTVASRKERGRNKQCSARTQKEEEINEHIK
jgi:hypothetical protein